MRRGVVISLVAVYLIWGSTYLVLRHVVAVVPALLSSASRYFVAGLVLLAVLRARGAPAPTARQWLLSIPTGGLMFLVGNGFVAIAEQEVSSGLAAVACAAMPLFACAISLPFGERPTRFEWLGVVLGFLGVILLAMGDLRAARAPGALLLLAPLGWALGSVLSRRLLPGGITLAATQMIGGAAVTFVAAALRGETVPTSLPAGAALALAYLIVFGSMLAFTAYTYLLRHTTTALATSYAYVNPVIAVVLAAIVDRERPRAEMLGAGALVVLGVAILLVGGRPPKPPAAGAGSGCAANLALGRSKSPVSSSEPSSERCPQPRGVAR
jgi:drug/metabolite transporter (DMT)-like permease